jgi:hypothetical protein
LALVSTDDPARRRLDELVALVAAGRADEAERTELELYLEDHPELRAHLAPAGPPADQHWLVRATADERVRRLERRRGVVAQRVAGGALLAGGFLLAPLLPVAAPIAIVAGAGVLVWSFVALRVRELRNDPYQEIDK